MVIYRVLKSFIVWAHRFLQNHLKRIIPLFRFPFTLKSLDFANIKLTRCISRYYLGRLKPHFTVYFFPFLCLSLNVQCKQGDWATNINRLVFKLKKNLSIDTTCLECVYWGQCYETFYGCNL